MEERGEGGEGGRERGRGERGGERKREMGQMEPEIRPDPSQHLSTIAFRKVGGGGGGGGHPRHENDGKLFGKGTF